MEGKTCFKCNKFLPFSCFYRHSKMSDGYLGKCKECAKQDTKENRIKRQEYYEAYDRQRAKLPHRRKSIRDRQKQNKDRRNLQVIKYSHKYPDRRKCNSAVSNALRDGKLEKLPCWICGKFEVEAHHAFYDLDFPLDVVWLCGDHHKECHRKYDHDNDVLILSTTQKGSQWDIKGQYSVLS